jgi:hypothetical protein
LQEMWKKSGEKGINFDNHAKKVGAFPWCRITKEVKEQTGPMLWCQERFWKKSQNVTTRVNGHMRYLCALASWHSGGHIRLWIKKPGFESRLFLTIGLLCIVCALKREMKASEALLLFKSFSCVHTYVKVLVETGFKIFTNK